jgi:septal ring factor EnvC (AmiA/AmiB activator)
MECTCHHVLVHRPDCPANPINVVRDDEERTILAHYRGDCHDGADCPACKAGFNYQERIGTQADKIGTLQRRLDQMGSSSTLNREIDRLEREVAELQQMNANQTRTIQSQSAALDRPDPEVTRLRDALQKANNTSAHRLRERQEAERQRDIAYAARDRALDDMQEVITGSRKPEPDPDPARPWMRPSRGCTPCQGNSNICVAEGCFGRACQKEPAWEGGEIT